MDKWKVVREEREEGKKGRRREGEKKGKRKGGKEVDLPLLICCHSEPCRMLRAEEIWHVRSA